MAPNDWRGERAKICTNAKNSIRRLSIEAIVKLLLGYSHFHFHNFHFHRREPPVYGSDYKPLTGVICSFS